MLSAVQPTPASSAGISADFRTPDVLLPPGSSTINHRSSVMSRRKQENPKPMKRSPDCESSLCWFADFLIIISYLSHHQLLTTTYFFFLFWPVTVWRLLFWSQKKQTFCLAKQDHWTLPVCCFSSKQMLKLNRQSYGQRVNISCLTKLYQFLID